MCRKRAFRQGHALPGRFAGLDVHALASGLIHSRATDEEASGGGLVKGSSQARSTKTAIQKSVSRLSRFSRIPTHGGNDTCKSVPAYAPQSFPDTYHVASHPAFRWPRRHAHYADLVLCQILTARLPHSVQVFLTYHLPASRMQLPPRLIRSRHIPDARIMRTCFCTDTCSFVRPCLRWPAYVLSIRCAHSLTAGKGPYPFEPRKAQRQGKR